MKSGIAAVTAALCLLLSVLPLPAAEQSDGWKTVRSISPGFSDGNTIVFLSDRRLVDPGDVVWFIVDFRFPDRVLERTVTLCRLNPATKKLTRLAVLENRPPESYTVRTVLFSRKGNVLAVGVAEKVRDPKKQGSALIIYLYDERLSSVLRVPNEREEEMFRIHFSGVKLPFGSARGMIPAWKLEQNDLKSITPEQWPDRP